MSKERSVCVCVRKRRRKRSERRGLKKKKAQLHNRTEAEMKRIVRTLTEEGVWR